MTRQCHASDVEKDCQMCHDVNETHALFIGLAADHAVQLLQVHFLQAHDAQRRHVVLRGAKDVAQVDARCRLAALRCRNVKCSMPETLMRLNTKT